MKVNVKAAAEWTERIFGPDVVAAEHEDPMTEEDWIACAILRHAGIPDEDMT